jgi:hypothetical protein
LRPVIDRSLSVAPRGHGGSTRECAQLSDGAHPPERGEDHQLAPSAGHRTSACSQRRSLSPEMMHVRGLAVRASVRGREPFVPFRPELTASIRSSEPTLLLGSRVKFFGFSRNEDFRIAAGAPSGIPWPHIRRMLPIPPPQARTPEHAHGAHRLPVAGCWYTSNRSDTRNGSCSSLTGAFTAARHSCIITSPLTGNAPQCTGAEPQESKSAFRSLGSPRAFLSDTVAGLEGPVKGHAR